MMELDKEAKEAGITVMYEHSVLRRGRVKLINSRNEIG